MPWYLILAAGIAIGIALTRAVIWVSDYTYRRPVDQKIAAQFRPTAVASSTAELDETPQRYGAADILGYNDFGGHRVAPTHPLTRSAHSSVAALAAWDTRQAATR